MKIGKNLLNNLVIGGILFKDKDIHKYTWSSHNQPEQNQFDLVAINGIYKTTFMYKSNGGLRREWSSSCES